MEEIKFSITTLIGYGLGAFAGWFLPLILWIIWRHKTRARYFPFVSGIMAYILISLVRMVIRIIFLRGILRNNFTDALISGVCEEVGRFLVFRYVLYEYREPENAVSYGIGHGGWEAFIVYGLNGLSAQALILALCYRIFGSDYFISHGDWTYEEAQKYLSALAEMNIGTSIVAILSDLEGMIFHITLSILVFIAVHSDNWKKYLLSAAGIHTLTDFLAAQLFGADPGIERLISAICVTAAIIYYVFMVYKKHSEENMFSDNL